jgi:hypothetical protein
MTSTPDRIEPLLNRQGGVPAAGQTQGRVPANQGVGQSQITTVGISVDDLERILKAAKEGTENNNQREQVLLASTLLKLAEKLDSSNELERKRRTKEAEEEFEEEEIVLAELDHKISDNGHDQLDWKARNALKPVNLTPKDYWSKLTHPVVENPILGSKWVIDHLTPDDMNVATLMKHADRRVLLKMKHYSPRNSTILQNSNKKMRMNHVLSTDGMSMDLGKAWEETNTVWEVVGCLLNFAALEQRIRPYSHAGISIIRALHELRWFHGIPAKNFNQLKALENFLNLVLHRNTLKAKDGKAPLGYQECKKLAKESLGEGVTKYLGEEEQGCPYSSRTNLQDTKSSSEEVSRLKRDLNSAHNTIKQLQESRTRPSFDRPRVEEKPRNTGSVRDDKSKEDKDYKNKRSRCCFDYNTTKGCSKSRDNCVKRHTCTKNIGGGRICWKEHSEPEHK